MQLIDHPPRTVQTPTMRSGGYGSIGRSSPKVRHFPIYLAVVSHMARLIQQIVSLLTLFTAQSSSVCGEVVQHTDQV